MQGRLVYNSLRPLVHLETRRGLKPKCVPQLYLGSLLGARRSAIGQFLPVLNNIPEVFAKVNSAQSPSRFSRGELIEYQ